MRFIPREEVRQKLDPDALLEVLASALRDVSSGAASVPPRIASFSPDGLLGAMIAYVPSLNAMAAKLVSVFAHHDPSHQAVIVVFDPKTGTPIAAMDGTEITAQRTAAVSALATRWLAREDARVLSIIGTGVQARSHAFHVARVRKFSSVLIAGRDAAKAAKLAAEVGARAVSLDEASQADVICLTTHSQTAVLQDARPGAHINSVGLHPQGSELSKELIDKCSLFVESRKSALAPHPAGAFELQGRSAVELGEIPAAPGRTSSTQITLYKSVGIAAEDAAAASLVLR
jgi:alanine dehydrogenase